jgi:hypothetical protein
MRSDKKERRISKNGEYSSPGCALKAKDARLVFFAAGTACAVFWATVPSSTRACPERQGTAPSGQAKEKRKIIRPGHEKIALLL